MFPSLGLDALDLSTLFHHSNCKQLFLINWILISELLWHLLPWHNPFPFSFTISFTVPSRTLALWSAHSSVNFFLQLFPPSLCLNPNWALPLSTAFLRPLKGTRISHTLYSSDRKVVLVSSLLISVPSLPNCALHCGSHLWIFPPHSSLSWPSPPSPGHYHPLTFLSGFPLSSRSLLPPFPWGKLQFPCGGPSVLGSLMSLVSSPGPIFIFAPRVQMEAHLHVQILKCYGSS